MKTIRLHKLIISGFMSFSKKVEISFDDEPGLKLLNGRNEVEPDLEGNGCGKSSLWLALIWCLYGKVPDGISDSARTSELTSWGCKRPLVTAELNINNLIRSISRQGNPNYLTIDGTPAEQGEVTSLLGLDFSRFVQSIIYGQGAPLFLDLGIPQRGELLDEVLQLGYWLEVSEVASVKARKLESELTALDRELATIEGKLSGLPDETMVRLYLDEWELNHRAKIAELQLDVDRLTSEIKRADHSAIELECALAEEEKVYNGVKKSLEDCTNEYNELRLLLRDCEHDKGQLAKQEHVFANDICPECGQEISELFAQTRLAQLGKDIETSEQQKAEVIAAVNEIERHLSLLRKELSAAENGVSAKRVELANVRGMRKPQESALAGAKRAMQKMEHEGVNPHIQQLNDLMLAKEECINRVDFITKEIIAKKQTLKATEFWKAGFKRVRLFQIKKILAVLEVEIIAAAHALGLVGWKIKLSTETETKSGTLKSGLQISIQSPHGPDKGQLTSGGERQRVALAVNLGLSNLIQRWAGVRFMWEVWDEPTNWLSGKGIEDLLECLQYRSEISKRCIWILDHRALTYSGFKEIWLVRKDKEGSRIELLTRST